MTSLPRVGLQLDCHATKALIQENLCIGTLASIEVSNQPVEHAKKGEEVCIKIENTTGAPRLIGRHFEATDELVTRISREGTC